MKKLPCPQSRSVPPTPVGRRVATAGSGALPAVWKEKRNRAREKEKIMAHTETKMAAERLHAIQDRRKSGAAGKHDSRPHRQRTRAASKSKAIAEFR